MIREREKEVPPILHFLWKEPDLMSSLRQDPLTGRWVIIAGQRHGRPNDFRDSLRKVSTQPPASPACPFCPGNEDQTPPEVMVIGRASHLPANGPGWGVRVVPNKYPAVHPVSGNSESTLLQPQGPAEGGHEVIICCPDHQASLGTLPHEHLEEILQVVRRRIKDLGEKEPSARYVLAFGNHGPDAGATLAHAHLQVITTPVVPAAVVEKTENFIRHREETNQCLLCETSAKEEAEGTRLIAANDSWVASTPWASRFPCEMRLIPRRHCSSMLECSEAELKDLAGLLSLCLKRLENHRSGAGYNLIIHNAALAAADGRGYGNERLDSMKGNTPDLFHWHVEILPRLSRQAGFEAGTGFAINSLPPEEAAVILRPERSLK